MAVFLKPDHLPVIERLAAAEPSDTIRKRVRLLLLYEAGMKTAEIAEKVELSPGRVLYWRRQYLKNGLAVFGNALDDLGSGKSGDESERNDGSAGKEGNSLSLAQLTRDARKARKNDGPVDEARRALTAGIKSASKRRKKLKKRMRRVGKKKTTKIQDRLKKLNRQIKKAKKQLRKL